MADDLAGLIAQLARLQIEHEEANQREFQRLRSQIDRVENQLDRVQKLIESNARAIEALAQNQAD